MQEWDLNHPDVTDDERQAFVDNFELLSLATTWEEFQAAVQECNRIAARHGGPVLMPDKDDWQTLQFLLSLINHEVGL